MAPRTALVLLGVWLNAADGLVTATIMPSAARELGGYAWFGWAVAIYQLGAILAGASAGQFARRLGLGRAMGAAALVYALGCVASALASHIGAFMLGRLAQGLGGGWVVGFCYIAISGLFPERLWARLFGGGAAMWGIASFAGPLVGGAFAAAHFWRGAFWMFAVQGLILAVCAPLLLRAAAAPPGAARAPIAWRTLAGLAAAVAAIAAADLTSGAAASIALLALGGALLVLAGRLNAAPGERLLPPDALRPATLAGAGYAMVFAMSLASVVFGVYGAAILQVLYGLSPLAAGYVVALDAAGWTVTALIVSGQPDRRHGALIFGGAATITVGLALLAAFIGSGQVAGVAVAAFVMGAGFGLAWSLATRRMLQALPPEDLAIGSAATPTTQLIGSAIGAAAAGAGANLLGLAHDFSPARAAAASPWLFAAFLPVALAGLAAAARLARGPALQGA
jgi:MFS family permease